MSGSESFRLRQDLATDVASVAGVAKAVAIGQNSVDATDNNTGKRLIDGIRFEEYSAISGLQIIEGRVFTPGSDEVIIDTAFQRQKKFSIGQTMPIYERHFTIVGAYEPAGGARVKMSWTRCKSSWEARTRSLRSCRSGHGRFSGSGRTRTAAEIFRNTDNSNRRP